MNLKILRYRFSYFQLKAEAPVYSTGASFYQSMIIIVATKYPVESEPVTLSELPVLMSLTDADLPSDFKNVVLLS